MYFVPYEYFFACQSRFNFSEKPMAPGKEGQFYFSGLGENEK
jgi:hypothetical protein